MDPHHLCNHHIDAAQRRLPRQADRHVVAAVEVDGAVLDARTGREDGRVFLVDAGDLKLVDRGRQVHGALVDGVAQVPGREVPDEEARLLRVGGGVFRLALVRVVGAEHDVRRVEVEVVELREWREVVHAGCEGGEESVSLWTRRSTEWPPNSEMGLTG